jgi:hypothetical protein
MWRSLCWCSQEDDRRPEALEALFLFSTESLHKMGFYLGAIPRLPYDLQSANRDVGS